MNHAITIELQFFLISILSGAIILLVYDLLRIFRRLIKHDGFFIALEDLFFWVGTSLFIFAMIYKENDGIIRGFCVMGMAIGMILYHLTLSDLLVMLITSLIHTLLSPIVFVINKVKKLFKFLWNRGKKIVNLVLGRLKKRTKSVRIALSKRKQAASAKRQKRMNEKMQVKQKKNEEKQVKIKNRRKPEQKGSGEQRADRKRTGDRRAKSDAKRENSR